MKRRTRKPVPVDFIECSKCSLAAVVPIAAEFFYRRDNGKPENVRSGWNTVCEHCLVEKGKINRIQNKERISQNKKEYYLANKEKILEYKKAWYYSDLEANREITRQKYHKNKETILKKNNLKRLETTKNKEFLLHIRWVKALPTQDRYLYDKYKSWESGAKIRALPFEISFEDIKTLWEKSNKSCSYSNEPLTFEVGQPNTISLDRIDSSKGYILDNLTFCCQVINLMKLDLSVHEFKDWCKAVANA